MELKRIPIKVDILKPYQDAPVQVVSGDNEGNMLEIELTTLGKTYEIGSNIVQIVFNKPDGTTVTQSTADLELPVTIEGNHIYCILKSNTIVSKGKVEAEIQITDGTKLITSALFHFAVRTPLINDKTIQSTNELSLLVAAVQAESLRAVAENQRNNNEVVRENAFNTKINALSSAITSAETAIQGANESASNAEAKASQANQAADNANEAASRVDTAIDDANAKAQMAETAAQSANTAAQAANAAKDGIQAQYDSLAQEVIQNKTDYATLVTEVNKKANATQGAWQTLTLMNGASQHGSYPLQVMKDNFGIVHLRGKVTTPSASNVQIATLPVGYRCQYPSYFACPIGSSPSTFTRVDVGANITTYASSQIVDFSGVSFDTRGA